MPNIAGLAPAARPAILIDAGCDSVHIFNTTLQKKRFISSFEHQNADADRDQKELNSDKPRVALIFSGKINGQQSNGPKAVADDHVVFHSVDSEGKAACSDAGDPDDE